MKTFGERLRSLRERRGWSQQDLAQRVHVSFMTVYRLETGRHQEPRLALAVQLARALGVSLDVLAGTYKEELSEGRPAAVALVGV